MAKQLSAVFTGPIVTFALFLAQGNVVLAAPGGGGGGGGRGGGGGYGGYGRGGYGGYGRGGYGGYGRGGYGYGGWGWGLGFGLGLGLGLGLYYPYYGFYEPYYGYGVYPAPAYDPVGYYGNASAAPPANGTSTMATQQSPEGVRPIDDAAHLQLLVPENAEVWVNGVKSPRTGQVQEMVTPALVRGNKYSYTFEVRYKDQAGKDVVDRRTIRFRANDWFSIDFTRPEPSRYPGPAPQAIEENQVK